MSNIMPFYIIHYLISFKPFENFSVNMAKNLPTKMTAHLCKPSLKHILSKLIKLYEKTHK